MLYVLTDGRYILAHQDLKTTIPNCMRSHYILFQPVPVVNSATTHSCSGFRDANNSKLFMFRRDQDALAATISSQIIR